MVPETTALSTELQMLNAQANDRINADDTAIDDIADMIASHNEAIDSLAEMIAESEVQ